MLTISLGLLFYVGVLTAVKQNNGIQRHHLSKTIIESRSRTNLSMTVQSPFIDSISMTNQPSINTVDQSVHKKMKRTTSRVCDGKCRFETSVWAEDGSRCICREHHLDLSPEQSFDKNCRKISSDNCPPKWRRLESISQNKCLRVFTGTGISELYASQFCGNYIPTAELAILDSRELAIFAGKLALEQGSFKTFRFGLSFDEDQNHWVWSSGINLVYESAEGALDLKEIDPMSGNRCATIVTTKDGSHWAATSCNNSDGFICQIDSIKKIEPFTVFLYCGIVYCVVATSVPIIANFAPCIHDCIHKYKKRRSDLSSSNSIGQEYISPITTFRTMEYQDPRVRSCNDWNNTSERVHTSDINHDDYITIITPSTITQRRLSQLTDQEVQNATTAAAINLHLTNDMEGAVDREAVDLPSYKLACQMQSPSRTKSIKMEVELEMDSDELPTYEDAVNP